MTTVPMTPAPTPTKGTPVRSGPGPGSGFAPTQAPLDLETLYKSYRTADTRLSFLILGQMGTGKTRLIGTARAPVLVDVFDPGGERTLRSEIASGRVVPDTRWSSFDTANPRTFTDWLAEMKRRRETPGFFERLGTYAIDSYTFLQNAAQAELRHKLRGEFDAKEQSVMYQRPIIDALQWVFNLPCDVVMTAHLAGEKDPVSGSQYFTVDAGGFLARRIPGMVDEVYVAVVKDVAAVDPKTGSPATERRYRLLTTRTGAYEARSRLGCLADYEEPDLLAIRRKAGLTAEDKAAVGGATAADPTT